MSSRDGLLVLFQNKRIAPGCAVRDGIVVCNTITGRVTSLPSMGSTAGMFKPALLSVEGAGLSFQPLVMYHDWGHSKDWSLRTQIFSSREHEWGAARRIHIHNMPPLIRSMKEAVSSTGPVVVGRSVHWLCYTQQLIEQPNMIQQPNIDTFIDRDLIILALHAESAQATVIKLPHELFTRISKNGPGLSETLILASTATKQGERQLSFVAAEALVISMWTLVADEGSSISWSRQVVIRRREIDKPLAYALDAYQPIWFQMYGKRSGTVLFSMQRIGLVQLNLGTD